MKGKPTESTDPPLKASPAGLAGVRGSTAGLTFAISLPGLQRHRSLPALTGAQAPWHAPFRSLFMRPPHAAPHLWFRMRWIIIHSGLMP